MENTSSSRSHYKSWLGLKTQLESFLCPELSSHITYFLTRYHKVHDAYGRASVRYDGNELCAFTWYDAYIQESDVYNEWKKSGKWEFDSAENTEKWNESCILSERNFLSSAQRFLDLPIGDALASDDYIVRLLAICDRRVGKRTLKRIYDDGKWRSYPDWLRQFYDMRLSPLYNSK